MSYYISAVSRQPNGLPNNDYTKFPFVHVKIAPARRDELVLITDTSPELKSSGSQHLKDIKRCLNKYSKLRVIQVSAASIDYHRSTPPSLENDDFTAPNDLQHVTLQTLFEDTVFGDAEQSAYLHRIRVNAYKFFDRFNREMDSVKTHSTVVIFVQWPGMIFLWEAFALSKWRTVPILMDRFEPLFIAFQLAKSSQALIRDSFNAALLQSDGILAGSKKGANALSKTLQVPCREIISVFRGISVQKVADDEHALAGFKRFKIPKDLLNGIALAGQIYARDTVDVFLNALERLNDNSNSDGPKFSLDYYGDDPIQYMLGHSCIVAHGSLEYEKLMASMGATCSFALVPYSFDEAFSSSAAFSFPSKLVAYVQAGIIPIYVGPEHSSVFELLDEYDLAELCITKIDANIVCRRLENIFLSDLDAFQLKLHSLSHVFKPEHLQHCINSVFAQIL